MRWFRRELDDFDVDWEFTDRWFRPVMRPDPFPTPWRSHPDAANCIVLPRSICYFFADEKKIRDIERGEHHKISELRDSIAEEGLKVPLKMTFDSLGKVRYHDGYHRLAAMRVLDEPAMVPVLLTLSDNRVKAYGRPPEQYMRLLFTELERAIYTP
jgi:hypothetical protein